MPEPIRRQNTPPRAGPELWVKRLSKNAWIVATILSEQLWGCWVHWNGKTTEPCFDDQRKCPGHNRQLPLRWKGYIHVFDHSERKECFLEVTPVTAENLLSQIGSKGSFRGARVKFQRCDGDKSRMKVELLGAPSDPVGLPAERDPMETLSKLWGLAPGKHLNGGKNGIPEA